MASLRDFIIKVYQETVKNHQKIPRELKEALAVHVRVPRFMDNLVHELKHPAFKNHSNEDLRKIIVDATEFFISLVQRKAHEQAMSELEKSRIRQRMQDKAVLDKAVDTGIIDEEVIDVLKRKGTEATTKTEEV